MARSGKLAAEPPAAIKMSKDLSEAESLVVRCAGTFHFDVDASVLFFVVILVHFNERMLHSGHYHRSV